MIKGIPKLAPDAKTARALGLVMFGIGFVLLIQGYDHHDTPWPIKLVHPLV